MSILCFGVVPFSGSLALSVKNPQATWSPLSHVPGRMPPEPPPYLLLLPTFLFALLELQMRLGQGGTRGRWVLA